MTDCTPIIVNGIVSHTREKLITHEEVIRLDCCDTNVEHAVSMTYISITGLLMFIRLVPGEEGVTFSDGDVFHVFNLTESNRV